MNQQIGALVKINLSRMPEVGIILLHTLEGRGTDCQRDERAV